MCYKAEKRWRFDLHPMKLNLIDELHCGGVGGVGGDADAALIHKNPNKHCF